VTDTFGNPVAGALVTYSAPSSGASASLSNGGIGTTDASGHTSVTATANGIVGGPYLVSATTGFLTPVTFSLTNLFALDVPTATGNGDILLATSSPGCSFSNVAAKTEAQVGNDPSFDYPYGLIQFTVNCPVADVSLTYTGATNLAGYTYRKYGPTTPGNSATTQWYTFNNVTVTGNTVVLHLSDGALGDDTGVDGIIVDQGGPGQPPTAIPTMTEWGMLAMVLLLLAGSIYHLRRRRTASL
jgi:hypothetical protein